MRSSCSALLFGPRLLDPRNRPSSSCESGLLTMLRALAQGNFVGLTFVRTQGRPEDTPGCKRGKTGVGSVRQFPYWLGVEDDLRTLPPRLMEETASLPLLAEGPRDRVGSLVSRSASLVDDFRTDPGATGPGDL